MENSVSKEIIFNWLKAWSISRNLPLPTYYKSGYKVDVGYINQKQRYVFPEINEDFFQLSNEINDSWIYLKFCGSPQDVENKISAKWKIQPQGYMMYCFEPMKVVNFDLSDNYKLIIKHSKSVYISQIVTDDGSIACEGRLIIVDDLAIYDRILTHDNHKRKRLASILIGELEK